VPTPLLPSANDSEENEHPIVVEASLGKYVAVFDPLDGSSNIDANVSIGACARICRPTTTPSDDVAHSVAV
jgi:fructose-1,6-bisphosphatase I